MLWTQKRAVLWTLLVGGALMASSGPQAGISADLAKKCRAMAIKVHPTEPAGLAAYAGAQREYFSTCVARNGNMQDRMTGSAPREE